MKPVATPQTVRCARSPARRRPTRGVGALDMSFDEPKHVKQRAGHIGKLIVAVLSILSAVAASYFITDATGSEVGLNEP